MPEGPTSSRTDRIEDPLLIPGRGSSAYSDPLSGDSPTASSDDTYIQVDDYAAYPDGAVSSSAQPYSTVSAANGLERHSSAVPQAEHHFSQREEGSAETAHTSSGEHVVMDVLTTQEPVTANGTADGTIETVNNNRDSSASPQPTRESGHGEVPTDVDEVLWLAIPLPMPGPCLRRQLVFEGLPCASSC